MSGAPASSQACDSGGGGGDAGGDAAPRAPVTVTWPDAIGLKAAWLVYSGVHLAIGPVDPEKRKADGHLGHVLRPGVGSRMMRAVSDAATGRPRSPRACDNCDRWLEDRLGVLCALRLQQCAAGCGLWLCDMCGEPIRVRHRRQRPDGSFSRWHRWRFALWSNVVTGGDQVAVRICDEVGGRDESDDRFITLEKELHGTSMEIKRDFCFFSSDDDTPRGRAAG